MEFWKNYGILKRRWKKVRAFFKKRDENMSGLRKVFSMFVASVITSLGLALRTAWAVALASAE